MLEEMLLAVDTHALDPRVEPESEAGIATEMEYDEVSGKTKPSVR